MPEKFKVRETVEIGKELVYPDGRTVTFLQAGQDEDGEYNIRTPNDTTRSS
ncbi:hypothetical protein [Mammaliicoccus lentus]|uniref:hypothetical protein n=1 Tax=Mammaliicoccus lentus TaxID=42858 RepID=UPI001C4FBCCD|nr:hypothetical protein [Mammaliicoccus lentus]MBW0766230.1 hypothetical protein [Mammaliicoccus lentus]